MFENNNANLDFLDMITIASFLAQIENMQADEKHTQYIHKVIENIEIEIAKLHKENDDIIKLLKEVKNGINK